MTAFDGKSLCIVDMTVKVRYDCEEPRSVIEVIVPLQSYLFTFHGSKGKVYDH